jgi:hypothetical protein
MGPYASDERFVLTLLGYAAILLFVTLVGECIANWKRRHTR